MASEPTPVGESATGKSSRTKTTESKVANGNGSNGSATVLPWIVAGIGMLGSIGIFVWGQINPKVDIGNVEARLNDRFVQYEQRALAANESFRRDIDEVKKLVELRLTISEHMEYKFRKDKDTERQDDQIRRLLQTRLSRDEHVKDLMALNERLNAQRDAMNKVQDSIGGGGVGKQLDNLQAQLAKQAEITAAQITELRRAIDMRPVTPLKP